MTTVKAIVQVDEKEIYQLAAGLAEKYAGWESTSVSEETARMLIEAVGYCIREAEAEAVSYKSVKEAYEKGYELVCAKLKKAEQLYKIIIKEFSAYENTAYYDTIIKGMPAFFQRYHPRFKPQDHILLLDYPLLADQMSLCGIDRIYEYLLKIRLEQRFLQKLPEGFVRQCLEEYKTGYEELFINICRIVLYSILKSMLIRKPLSEEFSYDYRLQLKELCGKLSEKELEERLRELLKLLIERQYGGNAALFDYMALALPELVVLLKNTELGGGE